MNYTQPITWETLKGIVHKNGLFYRRPEIEEAYVNHLSDIRTSNKDPSNVLNDSLFPDPSMHFRLKMNTFPYYTEPHVYNYVLWVNPRVVFCDKMYDGMFEKIKILLNDADILVHRNPAHARSIKGIEHYHIFSTSPPTPATNPVLEYFDT
jgi:hypothetical protein